MMKETYWEKIEIYFPLSPKTHRKRRWKILSTKLREEKYLQTNFNFRWQFKGSHQGCSMKKVFLKISQYSQESIIVGVSF